MIICIYDYNDDMNFKDVEELIVDSRDLSKPMQNQELMDLSV